MIINNETVYTADVANSKISVKREFDAPVEKVWRAWTEKDLLDQWWAPKPWKANTQSMNFREGGQWRYYMEGPDGSRHYCLVNYKSVSTGKSFTGDDAFCDENGNINTEFPTMHWNLQFEKSGPGTKVDVEITFATASDLEKIVEMGFKEGFAMAHNNLDELLATL